MCLCVCLSLFELREGGFLEVRSVAAYVLQHLLEEHDGRREEQHHLRERGEREGDIEEEVLDMRKCVRQKRNGWIA